MALTFTNRTPLRLVALIAVVLGGACEGSPTAPAKVPTIGSFSAAPTAIVAGASAVLSWTGVDGAAVCAIDNGIGVVSCANGNLSVKPTVGATYTLTVVGAGGSVTASAAVTVSAAPPSIASFVAARDTVTAGESLALSWTGVNGATACAIDKGIGAVACAGGAATVTPRATTTYTFSATGPGGVTSVTRTIVVSGAPPSIRFFRASPAATTAGQLTALVWSGIANASTCAINNGVGPVSCSDGRAEVGPAVTTAYTLTATGPGGTVTDEATVTVTPPSIEPAIGAFAVVPAVVMANETFTLMWSGIINATACTIAPFIGVVPCSGGSRSLASDAPGSTTFTLTASGVGGSASATASVTVLAPPPSMASFAATPSAIVRGQAAVLEWSGTSSATQCSIDQGIGAVSCGSRTLIVRPDVTTTYVFTATGPGGTRSWSTVVTVSSPSGSRTFEFTGSTQVFVVPAGVTTVTIEARGAQGGFGAANPAVNDVQRGGVAIGTFSVTPGETLTVIVGGHGGTADSSGVGAAGGFNGGAPGGSGLWAGGGGGGASDVRRGGVSLAHRIVIAGGGGGGGGLAAASATTPIGGSGGGESGSGGHDILRGYGGAGGSQLAGGQGGNSGANRGPSGISGTSGSGGAGGGGAGTSGGAGGGGGGFFGGGGGEGSLPNVFNLPAGGGGGGSGYVSLAASNPRQFVGVQAGHGVIVITWQ